MRTPGRIVTVLCGVAIALSAYAAPASASSKLTPACKKAVAAWTKENPGAALTVKKVEAANLVVSKSCKGIRFATVLKAL